ncbi:SDR family NAD(P)-dependent oxidoreductase [Helicobacter aurati]|nr:SDR family oxidoreductase [Helicobacter aurati]
MSKTANKPFILLSGATSGIGRSIALALSEEYSLIVLARDTNKVHSLQNELNHNKKRDFLPLLCDLSKIDSLSNILNQCGENTIQAFIHCAGLRYVGYAKTFNYAEMLEVSNVNLFACMEIMKYLLKKQKHSLQNCVFLSSAFSQKGEVGNSFYAATKGGLDSYMRSLALELAPKIRVNSIQCGGIFDTNMTNTLFTPAQKEKILLSYPLGEGNKEDIVHAVRFLLSKQARWITGVGLQVDGGLHI